MSKQPNLPGTAPVKRKHNEYPGRRCPHAVAYPVPHIKYQVEGLPGRRTIMRQTGLSAHSTAHAAARHILGSHVKHGTDYAVFEDENGFGGFVPKPGTIPEGARLTKPNICQWALPKPVSTAVITDPSTGANRPDATPEQRQRAASALQAVINASTGCYPEGVDDYILAGHTGLPADLISEVRVYLFGHPKPPIDSVKLLALQGEGAALAEEHLSLAARAEDYARRCADAMKLGA